MTIKVEGKVITLSNIIIPGGTWKNFSGKPTPYNRQGGKPGFTMFLEPEDGERLALLGFNVKQTKPKEGYEDEYEPKYRLNVNIGFDSQYPPKIVMITDGKPTLLNKDTAGILDSSYIENADIKINRYQSVNSDHPTAWLHTLYATIRTDEFYDKYGC